MSIIENDNENTTTFDNDIILTLSCQNHDKFTSHLHKQMNLKRTMSQVVIYDNDNKKFIFKKSKKRPVLSFYGFL